MKYECVYLRQFDTVSQARAGLKDYFEFYNYERLHQSLDYHTPAQVYLNNSSDNSVFYQPNSILILWLFGLDIGEYLIDLAEILISKNKFAEAKRELITYKNFKESKNSTIKDRFHDLYKKVENLETLDYDKNFYKENSKSAEQYLYKDIEWQPFLIYHSWKSKKNDEEMIAITDLKNKELAIKKEKFPVLKQSTISEVISCRVYFDKTKNRYTLLQVEKSDLNYENFIEKASTALAVVDHINQEKKLFHYYFNNEVEGVVKFSDTDLRPNVGDCLSIKYFMSLNNKSNKKEAQILKISTTSETNTSLIKTVQGTIELKYKHNGRTLDFDEALDLDLDLNKPDFAFIEDYYVHCKILKKYKINSTRDIKAKVIYNTPQKLDQKIVANKIE